MSTPTQPDYPMVYKENPQLRLAIIYNPFAINEVAKHELVWKKNKTLADYMEGLPEEVEWAVAVDGEGIPREEWATKKLQPHSSICVVRIPEGGNGGSGKAILRIVALISIAIFAPYLGGLVGSALAGSSFAAYVGITAIATAAITVGGALLVNALLGQPLNPSTGPTSSSYGVDGPKNTAKEGVPTPIVLGEFRVAGNITDCYTRNIGDDQYLFMRTVLHDGPVAGISDLQINNQPLTNFAAVEYRTNNGDGTSNGNSWFNEAIRLQTVQQQIDNVNGVLHATTSDVDRIRVDVAFPIGLYTTDSKGANHTNTITLTLEYQALDESANPIGSWMTLPLEAEEPLDYSSSSGILTLGSGLDQATFTVAPTIASDGTYNVQGFYRAVGSTTWIPAGNQTGNGAVSGNYGINLNSGFFGEPTLDNSTLHYTPGTATTNIQFFIKFGNPGHYQVMFTGGAVVDNTTYNPNLNSTTKTNIPGQANSLTLTLQSTNPLRVTYQSATLTRGRYNVRVKRTTADTLDPRAVSQCWVTDIGEIDNENVQYPDTAQVALKIKLTNQLSGIPTFSALVTGANDIKVYDESGNVVSTGWSQNPAWQSVWMLTDPTRGGNEPSTKIDWPSVVSFAQFCDANGYYFNGVFDFVTTLWDGVQSVARLGHGTMVPVGTKYGFIMDGLADPVMVFSGANMFADTFKKTWVNLSDRANEVQQQFYDKTDSYRQKTIRLPDLAGQSRANKIKPATSSGFGLTNIAQATAEADYQARSNTYIDSTITFDAPLEAVGLQLGDVALIQHDSVQYGEGVGGRIEAGSTTTLINLDRPVTMNAGETYSLMVVIDSLLRYSPTVTSISQNKLTVSGLPDSGLGRIRRLVQNTHDVEVIKVLNLSPGVTVITVSDATGLTTGGVGLWDTDVIEERTISTAVGSFNSVTVTSAFDTAPIQYANFLFGQAVTVKQPYRLRTISATDSLTRRSLGFVKYDARVYGAGTWGVPQLIAQAPNTIAQVGYLHLNYDRNPAPAQQRIKVTLDWTPAPSLTGNNTYGGADIYVQINGSPWKVAGSVSNSSIWSGDYNRGDTVVFQVVAYDLNGNRAPIAQAPQTSTTLTVIDSVLDAPTTLAFTVPTYRADASAHITWTAPSSGADDYAVHIAPLTSTDYTALTTAISSHAAIPANTVNAAYVVSGSTPDTQFPITKLDVGYYVVRVRTEIGFAVSPWVYLPVRVTTPIMPFGITGLQLNKTSGTTFNGTDATWTWDDIISQAAVAGNTDIPFLCQDYQVQIFDASNNLLRTEYTSSPAYNYTIAKNQYDSTGQSFPARRNFTIKVAIRGKQGQLSSVVSQSVSNPAPSLGSVNTNATSSAISIAPTTQPTDPDFQGVQVWASTSSGFSPGSGNLVYQGPLPAIFTAASATTYYYRYAYYDAFGTSGINVSGEASIATSAVTATTVPWTGVTGTGKPADNATVGALVGNTTSNLITDGYNSAPAYLHITDTYTPFGTSADFAGRGGLARLSSVDLAGSTVINKDTNYLTDGAGLGTRATWTGVTGTGKPQDNATVGAAWGTNLTSMPTWSTDTRTVGGFPRLVADYTYTNDGVKSLATYFPATTGADQTSGATSADFAGRGGLARLSSVDLAGSTVINKKTSNLTDDAGLGTTASWGSVASRPTWVTDTYTGTYTGPKADYINNQYTGTNLNSYWPSTTGADQTSGATAADFVGRGALARLSSVDLAGTTVTNKNSSYLTDGAGWSTTALWTGVTGTGKAADNATVGAYVGNSASNLTTDGYNSAPTTLHITDTYTPFGTAADFVGRGTLARLSSVDFSSSVVTNKNSSYITDGAGWATTALWTGVTGTGRPADNATVGATWGTNLNSMPGWSTDTQTVAGFAFGPTLKADYIFTQGVQRNLATYFPSTTGADQTSGATSADFVGRGTLARLSSVDLAGTTVTNKNSSYLTDGAGWATTALWSGVTGSGKAADNATVGAYVGNSTSNLTTDGYNSAPTTLHITDTYTPFGTAADFVGRGGLARLSSVDLSGATVTNKDTSYLTDGAGLGTKAVWGNLTSRPSWATDTRNVSSTDRLVADYITTNDSAKNLASYFPSTTGADQTSGATAADFAGRGNLARLSSIDLTSSYITGKSLANLDSTANTNVSNTVSKTQYMNTSGTMIDGRGLTINTQTAQGYTMNPGYPLNSSVPGTSIAISATTFYTPGYSFSLSSGTVSGTSASTAYAVFWDTVASAYYALSSGASAYYTDNTGRYISMGTITTASSTTGAPPGGGGGGHPIP